jgi:hypothetical protein
VAESGRIWRKFERLFTCAHGPVLSLSGIRLRRVFVPEDEGCGEAAGEKAVNHQEETITILGRNHRALTYLGPIIFCAMIPALDQGAIAPSTDDEACESLKARKKLEIAQWLAWKRPFRRAAKGSLLLPVGE